ncbi:MAG: acylphosphatase [Chloroflexi bacterium]|nr:acylphosphatase [Chloroflexota bacterium]
MADRRLELRVEGRVQGVGFRMFIVDRAQGLGLRGWVANEPDGAVRVVAEGPENQLVRLLVATREGPVGARVDDVDETWAAALGVGEGFTIRSGWHRGD